MSNNSKNWYENYKYLYARYESAGDLPPFPKTWKEIKPWINKIDENIPDIDLKALLKRIPINDYRCIDNAKELLAENNILKKRTFDKIWKEIEKENLSKQIEKQKITQQDLINIAAIPERYLNLIEDFLISEKKFEFVKEILDFKIVGEDDNKVLIFILLSGAYFNAYQIILISGESTGGKTNLANNVIMLFPKTHICVFTGATDKAIIYKEWDKEKMINFNEAHRNPEILENLKDFGDSGIIYYTVERDEDGKYVTREIVIGKKSVIATTTIEKLNTQLENRSWKLEPDLSTILSKKIVNDSIKKEKNQIEKIKREKELKEKKKILKYSILTIEKEYDFSQVEIPYSDVLNPLFNYNYVKIRRDHKKFLNLIKIIASWNYKIRNYYEYENEKIILSHPNDLIIAFEIGKEIFMNISQNLSVEKIKILLCVDEMNSQKDETLLSDLGIKVKKKWFKTNEIYKYFCKKEKYRKSDKSFRNLLNVLCSDGYLSKDRKGASNIYKLEESPLLKQLDEEGKMKIIQEGIKEYTIRKLELMNDNNIEIYENEILNKNKESNSIEDLVDISIYRRIIDMFKANKDFRMLYEENIIQLLSLDFKKDDIIKTLEILIRIGKITKKGNELYNNL